MQPFIILHKWKKYILINYILNLIWYRIKWIQVMECLVLFVSLLFTLVLGLLSLLYYYVHLLQPSSTWLSSYTYSIIICVVIHTNEWHFGSFILRVTFNHGLLTPGYLSTSCFFYGIIHLLYKTVQFSDFKISFSIQ